MTHTNGPMDKKSDEPQASPGTLADIGLTVPFFFPPHIHTHTHTGTLREVLGSGFECVCRLVSICISVSLHSPIKQTLKAPGHMLHAWPVTSYFSHTFKTASKKGPAQRIKMLWYPFIAVFFSLNPFSCFHQVANTAANPGSKLCS